MRDKVIIYDQIYNPAVTGAILPNVAFDMAALLAAQRALLIEDMYLWPSYTLAGLPADIADVEIWIDGAPYPPTPNRLHIRARADRNMAIPYDQRYAAKHIKFGTVSANAVEDTTVKITPAQRVNVRINSGAVAGILATDSPLRVMLVGRIAETDQELRDIYGTSMYDPAPRRLGDPVTGMQTPLFQKPVPLTIDNVKLLSGATGQQKPTIFPFWTWARNHAIILPTPEYPWSYTNPFNVDFPFQELRFDWTRITDEALQIRYMGAYIVAPSAGLVWWDQPPLRRPGHRNLFFGWPVDSGFPNLLPGGGDTAMAGAGMFQGPLDLKEVGPQLLAFNNLTELRAVANAGTTIPIGNLEIQVRGVHINF